jgi:hypothetical protein
MYRGVHEIGWPPKRKWKKWAFSATAQPTLSVSACALLEKEEEEEELLEARSSANRSILGNGL